MYIVCDIGFFFLFRLIIFNLFNFYFIKFERIKLVGNFYKILGVFFSYKVNFFIFS